MNLPAGHETQVAEAVAAVAVLYVPAPQTTQSPSSSWLVALVAASARYVPAGHDTQVLEAVAAVYVPAPQIKQSATSSCKDANDAASLRYLPVSQDVQVDKAVALYLPNEHTEQAYEKSDPETAPPTPSSEPFVADDV